MSLALIAAAPFNIATTFDPAEVAWFDQVGANTIRGNAVLRTVGGEARTCAGLEANLVPASRYAEARFGAMFGPGAERGLLAADSGFSFASTDPEYVRRSRTTRCDSDGDFSFANLPDGRYFVTAFVTWSVPSRFGRTREGGVLMQRVDLAGGETKDIVLAAP